MRAIAEEHVFDRFEFNHCYAEADMIVSLSKLKQHLSTGATPSMTNQFGLTVLSVSEIRGR